MTDALWYTARGTGLAALLLTVSLTLGIVVHGKQRPLGLHRFGLTQIHRTASLTACGLIAVHVVTLLLDPYAQLKLVDVVVPFLGAYRPFWLGLGTVAVDLLLAVVVTSIWRRRFGTRVFRAVHWAAYALWPIAFFHALGTGSDRATGWYLACVVAAGMTAVSAVAWRTTETL